MPECITSFPEWRVERGYVPYPDAVQVMQARANAIREGEAQELLWLVEHEPLYTAGRSAKGKDLLEQRYPVYEAERGGQYTYHGPGQRVIYTMLDLKARMREPDVRRFVWLMEEWVIRSLAHFQVEGERREGRVGIWVRVGNTEKKIAALGIKLKRWVSYHGIAVNIAPDLSHYTGIVPCGISEYGVTSLQELGKAASMEAFDAVLKEEFTALPW